MTRNDILTKAAEIVGGHRTTEYGEPEDNFGIIARLWSAYLGVDISAVDVSMLMVLFKAARVKTGTGTEDSFIDIAGYAACGGEINSAPENMPTAGAGFEEGKINGTKEENTQEDLPTIFDANIILKDGYSRSLILYVMTAIIDRDGYISVASICDICDVAKVRNDRDFSYVVTDLNGVEFRVIGGCSYLHLPVLEYKPDIGKIKEIQKVPMGSLTETHLSEIRPAPIPIKNRDTFVGIIDTMMDLIDDCGRVTVADVYRMVGIPLISRHWFTEYGWTATDCVEFVPVGDTNYISLPPASYLGPVKNND